MDFSGPGGLFILGPSTSPQPVPYKASYQADFELAADHRVAGVRELPVSFLCRYSFRLLQGFPAGRLRVVFNGEADVVGEFSLALNGEAKTAHYSNGSHPLEFDLPRDLHLSSVHEVSIEVDYRYLKIACTRHPIELQHSLGGKDFRHLLYFRKRPRRGFCVFNHRRV